MFDLEAILNLDVDSTERQVRRRRGIVTRRRPNPDAEAARFVVGLKSKLPARRCELIRRAAAAVRVLQKVGRQIATGAFVRLSAEELETFNGLLGQSLVWEARPVSEDGDEGAPLVEVVELVPARKVPFGRDLYQAARDLVGLWGGRSPEHLALCEAPLRPADRQDTATCGRLFVAAKQGGPAIYCSNTCRQRVKRRKQAEKNDERLTRIRKRGRVTKRCVESP